MLAGLRAPRGRRGNRRAPPRRRAARGAPRRRARRPSSTSSTAPARSSCTRASDVLGEERFALLTSLDLGDLIGVDGAAMRSRHGELSLRVEDFQVLGKALRPPPDKHHGLTDVETRYRHRELDLIASEETPRSCSSTARGSSPRSAPRSTSDGFIEVETPVLQPLYGGALARPFTTHHNALDRDLYLRIATELYLKRLIVGGLERVYELGKDFRNEGVSHKHNPEFTMVEWYEAYADYEDAMARAEAIVAAPRPRPSATTGELDFAAPWRRRRLRRRDPRGDRDRRRARTATPAALAARDRAARARRQDRRAQLARARRRPALQVRRAEADAADVRHRLPDRALAVRARAPPTSPGSSSASRRSPAGMEIANALQRARSTPTSSARASTRSSASTAPRRGRRRSPTTRSSCRRSSRGCRRPAASASASTAW